MTSHLPATRQVASAAAADRPEVRTGPGSPRLPDRAWVPALFGLLLAMAFVGALLVRAEGDVSLLVHAAPVWTDTADNPPGSLTVQPDPDDAFDGQFFYRLGVSPLSTDETVAGVTFDLPSLRNARWGYGALAFLASGGDRDLVPWALVGLNVATMAAVGAVGGGLARQSGRHAAWGALLVLWPGFAYSLSLDTSELVAAAFALGGLLAVRHRRWIPAAALLSAAVLTRDTTAVVPFGVAAAGAWQWAVERHPAIDRMPALVGPSPSGPGAHGAGGSAAASGDIVPALDEPSASSGAGGEMSPPPREPPASSAPIVTGAVALVVFGAWQVVQRVRFGALPLTSSGDNNLSVPFGGFVEQAAAVVVPSGAAEALRLLSMIGLVALVGAATWSWRKTIAPATERVTWLGAVAVVIVLNAYLWSGATAFMRAATEAGLLSILVLLGSRRTRLLPLAAVGLSGLWALTAIAQLAKLG